MVLPGCQQEPVAPVVQHAHVWLGREGKALLPAQKGSGCFAIKSVRAFRGVSHTVEVTLVSLCEAVAQGLEAIRGHEWVAGIA